MGKFSMSHDLDCDVDKFWHLFLHEPGFNDKLYNALEFPEWKLVEQKEEGNIIHRVAKATPKMDAPAAVAKLLGDRFGYTERGKYDKTTKLYTFVIETSAMKDKLRNEGSVRCEPRR